MGDKSEILDITVTSEVKTLEVKMANNKTVSAVSDHSVPVPSFVIEEEPILGIPFTFSRFGLYHTPGSEDNRRPAFAPFINNFSYGCFSFNRGGSLYVYFEQRKGKKVSDNWYEYNISWNENGNELNKYTLIDRSTFDSKSNQVRVPLSSAKSRTYIEFDPGDIAWIAYSETQWSSKQVLNIMKDESAIKNRFQKLDVDDWLDTNPIQDEPINEQEQKIKDFFENTTTNTNPVKILPDKDHSGYYYYYSVNMTTHGNMMYSFALNDPLGCADVIDDMLTDKYLRLDSLIFSLRTSKSPDQIYNELTQHLVNDVSTGSIFQEEDQYNALYETAFILNSVFLQSNNSQIEKYKGQINSSAVNLILAVRERTELRKEIDGYTMFHDTGKRYMPGLRDSLADIMGTNYYQNALLDYDKNCIENIGVGYQRALCHLDTLSKRPQDKEASVEPGINLNLEDKYMSLVDNLNFKYQEVAKSNGEELKYKTDVLGFQNVLAHMLSKDVTIPKPDKKNNSIDNAYNNAGIFLNAIDKSLYISLNNFKRLTVFNGATYDSRHYEKVLDGYVNKISKTLHNLEKIEKINLSRDLAFEEMARTGKAYHTPGSVQYGTTVEFEKRLRAYDQKAKNHIGNNKQKSFDHYRFKDLSKKLENFATGKTTQGEFYKMAFSIMSAITLFRGLLSSAQNLSNGNFEEKDFWSTSAAYLSFRSFILSWPSSENANRYWTKKIFDNSYLDEISGRKSSNNLGARMFRRGVSAGFLLGALGTTITSVISICEGFRLYNQNNERAGIVSILEGAMGMVYLGVMTTLFLTKVIVSFYINFFVFIFFLLVVWVKSKLTNDFLESFIECTPLKAIASPSTEMRQKSTAYDMRKYLYDNKKYLAKVYKRSEMNYTGDDCQKIDMKDFTQMPEWLMNLFLQFSATATTEGYLSNRLNIDSILYYFPNTYTFYFRYMSVYPNSELEVTMVLYPKGFNDNDFLKTNYEVALYDKDENPPYDYGNSLSANPKIEGMVYRKYQHSIGNVIKLHKNVIGNQCCYILYARIVPKEEAALDDITNNEEKESIWPLPDKTGEVRYAAFYETVLADHVPNPSKYYTRYNYMSRNLKEEETRFTLSNRAVYFGTKNDIFIQIAKQLKLKE